MVGEKTLFQAVRRDFAALVKLNLLFLCACIPLVTVGPALLTLFEMVQRVLREESVSLWQESREAFCRHIKAGLALELILFAFWWLWALSVNFYLAGLRENAVYGALLLGVMLAELLLSCVCVYLLPLMGGERLDAKRALRQAILLAIAKPGRTLLSLLFILGVLVLTQLFSLYAVPFMLIIGCSGTVLFITITAGKPIDQFIRAGTAAAEEEG